MARYFVRLKLQLVANGLRGNARKALFFIGCFLGLNVAIGGFGVLAAPRVGIGAAVVPVLVYSALFALCLAYTIWYAAVRAIGSARTAVYSNLLPIVAMITAWLWLYEPIGPAKIAGTTAVLAGVALTRQP